MELLGFPGITRDEESLIRQKLERLRYLPLTRAVEDVVISLRQTPRSNCQTLLLPPQPYVPESNC